MARLRIGAQANRVLWALSAVIAAALGVGSIAYGVHLRAEDQDKAVAHTADGDVRHVVIAFGAALREGDLGALRELTCGEYNAGFFTKITPEQYKEVYDNQRATGGVPVLDSVDAVVVTQPTAQALATMHYPSAPKEREPYRYTLRQDEGQWRICAATGPAAAPPATSTSKPGSSAQPR